MNVLILYTNSPFKGAGGVVFDFFNELKKKGHHVKVLVNDYDPAEYPEEIINLQTYFLYKKREIIHKILTKLKLKKKQVTNPDYHFQDLDERKTYFSTNALLRKAGIKPDVIIVFFAKNFISAKNIYELNKKTGAPVFWLLYDMAAFTGGCHYAWDCTGYQNSCGNCPGLYSSNSADITNQNLEFKKRYLDKTDIRIVSGSEWQYRQAKKSTLFKNKTIHKILNGTNHEIFKPAPKEIIRKKLGLSPDRKIIFFGAVYLDHKRKGFKYLLEALKILKTLVKEDSQMDRNILLLIAGLEFDDIKKELPFEYHYMGMLDNGPGIASAYQAADVFVCPSIEDSGPMMINQSVMCGTPVVSFETGVSPDLVINGETGYCAQIGNSKELAMGINTILQLNESEAETMKNKCRKLALELIHPEVNLSQWLKVLTIK
jgi:glycosyltransferase involved in cell wall biosynthesis